MSKKLKFHFYIKDINLLNKSRKLIKHFDSDAEIAIYENKDLIPKDMKGEVIIMSDDINFFYKHFCQPEKRNMLIVFNDILNDLDDYPTEVYISKNRVLTSMAAVLYDLKNSEENFDYNYFSVKIDNIEVNIEAPCDLYLNLGDMKFLKCFNEGDRFDEISIERFSEKSEYLWVKKEDFYLYGDFLYGKDDLERKISPEFSVAKVSDLELLHDMAKSCGISEKTLRSVKGSMDHLKEDSGKKIKQLIMRFDKLEGSFLYSHSYFTALIVVEIASKFTWYKNTHTDKLVLAALLHDLGYKDETNALYEVLGKLKVVKLPKDIQQDVLEHINEIIAILMKEKDFDSDVINIIKSHHGARGEDSYPSNYFATEMDLLSGIFLLSHVFSTCLFKLSFDVQKVDHILAYIELNYNKGNLRKIFPDFKKHINSLF